MCVKKIWDFIWNDNSFWSWIITFVIALLIVKFLVFPVAGLVMGTNFPIVAVVSGSMEHNNIGFDEWWEHNKAWYIENDIIKEDFLDYKYKNGFNKGDVMLVYGTSYKNLKKGDVIIFQGSIPTPIIHRIVSVNGTNVQTKGDNNPRSDPTHGELNIGEDRYLGRAVLRIPYAGWLKIMATDMFESIRGSN